MPDVNKRESTVSVYSVRRERKQEKTIQERADRKEGLHGTSKAKNWKKGTREEGEGTQNWAKNEDDGL